MKGSKRERTPGVWELRVTEGPDPLTVQPTYLSKTFRDPIENPITTPTIEYLRVRELPYSWETRAQFVAFPASTAEHSWTVYALCHDERHQLIIHSVRDGLIPDESQTPISEFVIRANFGLVLGNFELDFDEGEFRFKTSIDVEGDRLTDALLDHLVLANIGTFGRYLPGVEAVLAGADPAMAVATIEAN